MNSYTPHTHSRTHALTHARTHARTHTRTHVCIHHTHSADTRTPHTRTHTPHIHARTHARTHAHTHHTQTHQWRSEMLPHMHVHVHAHTNTKLLTLFLEPSDPHGLCGPGRLGRYKESRRRHRTSRSAREQRGLVRGRFFPRHRRSRPGQVISTSCIGRLLIWATNCLSCSLLWFPGRPNV